MLVQHVVLHREGAITLGAGTWSAKEGLYTGRGLDRVLVCGMLMRAYCIHREGARQRVLVYEGLLYTQRGAHSQGAGMSCANEGLLYTQGGAYSQGAGM